MKTIPALLLVLIIGLSALLGYFASPAPFQFADLQAPAITHQGTGVLVKFRISLEPGNGRTLINIQNSEYKQDAENAVRKARKNAENILGIKLSYTDLIVDVGASGSEVGGESAGAMFAVGIISAYTGKKIKNEVAMSAGITEDGKLFPVESIEEKILAAIASGKKTFVVADAQVIKNEENLEIEVVRVSDLNQALAHTIGEWP
ncbi:hypothetical protein HY571_01710 [Candidatus Micrarchaeota archaeon]|nr:hypothetical protein [Candidatus Micrarchaeota archaeon]